VNQDERCVQCICLAPTYELAMQIGEVVKEMSQFMPKIKMRYAIRGETCKWTNTFLPSILSLIDFRIAKANVLNNLYDP
jgi:superfamily II DNA/RNA helicase